MGEITNYLSPLEFELSIKRLPAVEFFVQRASIPGINMSFATQPAPFNNVFHSPDKLEYQELSITFIIDEKAHNYIEIFDWMHGLAFPQEYTQYRQLRDSREGLYSDIVLNIKNSAKKPNLRLQFLNAFPISLSEVMLDTTQPDIIYPEATVTFKYDSFKFIKNS